MLENGLIRKTKTGKLYNISFKYDSEAYAGKYKERLLRKESSLTSLT